MEIEEIVRYHQERARGLRPVSSRNWHKEAAERLESVRRGDRLERVIVGLRYMADEFDDISLREVLAMTALVDACVCNVGVQDCPAHPGRLFTIDQRFEFERAWDRKVKS